MSLVYWDREAQEERVEKVAGNASMKFLYQTPPGRMLARTIVSHRVASRVMGTFNSSKLSARQIKPFIRNFSINMDEYEPGPFPTFNDFFIRRFKEGVRPFAEDSSVMPALAEGRYLGYAKIEAEQEFPVKGKYLTPELILSRPEYAKHFAGGPLLIARLCPVDYHRFHFPCYGKLRDFYRLHGRYYSVNPVALKAKADIFATNERHVAILETDDFGKLAYVEVGATGVGKIIQSFSMDLPFQRGQEKGYFLFGASTVILFGEPGRWKPDQDILEKSSAGRETFIKLGAGLARSSVV